MIKTILALIPVKQLVKFLPDILAYILTKSLGYLFTKHPDKVAKAMETAKDITTAMVKTVEASEDNVITKDELNEMKSLWKAVFK